MRANVKVQTSSRKWKNRIIQHNNKMNNTTSALCKDLYWQHANAKLAMNHSNDKAEWMPTPA